MFRLKVPTSQSITGTSDRETGAVVGGDLRVIPSRADGEGPSSEVPNPKTQITGKVSKHPNSNGWHQLLWELKPWDFEVPPI